MKKRQETSITISGCIITIDAMGCQKEIASKILQKGADYSCSKIKCPPLKFSNDFVYVRQYTALSHLNGHFISDRLYVLALKGNQQSLYEDASLFLDDIEKKALKNISYDFEKTVEKNHGRIEIRKDHSPENFAFLRHIVLNMLKNETSAKVGIKNKRLKAGWDEQYLEKLLIGK